MPGHVGTVFFTPETQNWVIQQSYHGGVPKQPLLLNTTKQVALAPKRGNTTSQSSAIKIDSTPVPKRKKT